MTRSDLVARMATAAGWPKAGTERALRAMLAGIQTSLKRGDSVTLVGFGTFSVSQRKARNGRNPQTGSVIKIAARKVAKFTPGVELKKAVNKK